MDRTVKEGLYLYTGLLMLLAILAFPFILLIFKSLYYEQGISFSSFDFLSNKAVVSSLLNSIGIAIITALCTVVLGVFFSFYLYKVQSPYASVARMILLLPLFISPYTVGVMWLDLFFKIGINPIYLQNQAGVIWVLIITYTPVSLFVISGSWKNIASSLEESGRIVAPYRQVIWKIVLPLMRPALVSSFIVVFILSISEYGLPSVYRVNTFTVQLFTEFTAFYNYAAAYAQSLVLIVISMLLIIPERRYLSDAPFFSLSKKSGHLLLFRFKKYGLGLFIGILYLTFTVIMPFLWTLVQSFYGNTDAVLFAINQLSPVLLSSLIHSFIAALCITLLGYLFSLASVRYGHKTADLILLLLFSVPSLVTGIALIQFYNTPSLQLIYASSVIIIIGYTTRFVFIANKIIAGSLRQIPPSYEDAVKIINGRTFSRIIHIQLPLISEGVFNAFFIVFLFCFSEISTTIMLYPPGTSLLPLKVFTLMANASQSQVSAMNSFVVLVTILIVMLIMITKKLSFNQRWRITQA